jgi:hypothetical protein
MLHAKRPRGATEALKTEPRVSHLVQAIRNFLLPSRLLNAHLLVLLDGLDVLVAVQGVDGALGELDTIGITRVISFVVLLEYTAWGTCGVAWEL